MSYMTEANIIADQIRGQGDKRKGGKAERLTPSKHQLDVLAFMRSFFAENDQLPPYSVIAEHFGIRPTGAEWHVNKLIKFGRLERNVVGKLRFARAKGGAP